MSTPSGDGADRAEQQAGVVREPEQDVPAPFEAVGADVAEQAAGVGPPEPPAGTAVPLEADAADAADQAAVVELDEDEHR